MRTSFTLFAGALLIAIAIAITGRWQIEFAAGAPGLVYRLDKLTGEITVGSSIYSTNRPALHAQFSTTYRLTCPLTPHFIPSPYYDCPPLPTPFPTPHSPPSLPPPPLPFPLHFSLPSLLPPLPSSPPPPIPLPPPPPSPLLSPPPLPPPPPPPPPSLSLPLPPSPPCALDAPRITSQELLAGAHPKCTPVSAAR